MYSLSTENGISMAVAGRTYELFTTFFDVGGVEGGDVTRGRMSE
jgi:hypothetical protein